MRDTPAWKAAHTVRGPSGPSVSENAWRAANGEGQAGETAGHGKAGPDGLSCTRVTPDARPPAGGGSAVAKPSITVRSFVCAAPRSMETEPTGRVASIVVVVSAGGDRIAAPATVSRDRTRKV